MKDIATERFRDSYPTMRFTAVYAEGTNSPEFKKAAQELATKVTAELADTALRASLEPRLQQFKDFFDRHQQKFPLDGQIKQAAKRGFPPVPTPILALLALEAGTGTLMGVQDAKAVEGDLQLDVADEGDSFTGMRGKEITCDPEEPVLRDRQDIIAAYFQGPDKRTAITPETDSLVFYVFDAEPSLADQHEAAVNRLTSLLEQARLTFHTDTAE